MKTNDVIIIGAGPAGLSAAIVCRKYNLEVIILDEFPQAGGRLLGQLHEEPNGEWWNGIKESQKLIDQAKNHGANILCNYAVHHIERVDNHFIIHTNKGNFTASNVLIATGAAETAAPIPGWTLPGVMSIGAAQVMTNVHRVRVGQKGIVVGVNVLSAAIARELQLAGIDLHSMALPATNVVTADQSHPEKVMQRLVRIAHLAPSAFIKFGSKFAKAKFIQKLAVKFYPRNGVKMWGMPIYLRKAITEINGTDKVESVTIVDITSDGEIVTGSETKIPVDFVCIAGGLYPLAELASVAGCSFKFLEELGGHIPVHNEAMETTIDGIFVAGNITGIESAKVAREQGKVAGYSIVKKVAKTNMDKEENGHSNWNVEKIDTITNLLIEAMSDVRATREAATIQFHPQIERGRTKIHAIYTEERSI